MKALSQKIQTRPKTTAPGLDLLSTTIRVHLRSLRLTSPSAVYHGQGHVDVVVMKKFDPHQISICLTLPPPLC
jgi:hypothetical protein